MSEIATARYAQLRDAYLSDPRYKEAQDDAQCAAQRMDTVRREYAQKAAAFRQSVPPDNSIDHAAVARLMVDRGCSHEKAVRYFQLRSDGLTMYEAFVRAGITDPSEARDD